MLQPLTWSSAITCTPACPLHWIESPLSARRCQICLRTPEPSTVPGPRQGFIHKCLLTEAEVWLCPARLRTRRPESFTNHHSPSHKPGSELWCLSRTEQRDPGQDTEPAEHTNRARIQPHRLEGWWPPYRQAAFGEFQTKEKQTYYVQQANCKQCRAVLDELTAGPSCLVK